MSRCSSANTFRGSGVPSGVCTVASRSAALRRVGLKLRTPSRASVAFIRLTMRVRSPTRHSNSDKRSEPGFDGWDRPLVRRPYWSLHDSSLERDGFELSVPREYDPDKRGARDREFADSPLEGNGFEPLVPQQKSP